MNESAYSLRWKLIAAFSAVYLIWGSTYLGIRFAIQTIPPFLMAAMRFLISGSMLYTWLRVSGAPKPDLHHWRSAAITGFLLLGIGNGGLSWSEQVVPSGIAALIIAITPLWFVLIEWFQHAVRPSAETVLGLALGTVGMVILIDPARISGAGSVDLLGAGVLLTSSFCWTLGSLYSRRAKHPPRPLLGTAMQMLVGGGILLVVSFGVGEFRSLDLRYVSSSSLLALAYLIVFGSLIAFSSYIWLLKASTPARVSTYAYVNPIVAVFLGWLLAGEELNGRIALAAAIIVASVAIITSVNIRQLSLLFKKTEGAE